MAYDFPASPILNQTFNNYVWDGEKWKLQSPPVTGAVRYDIAQSLNSTQRSQARANVDVTKKNYIINGAMMVSQEFGTTTLTLAGNHPADQFFISFGNTTATENAKQIASPTPGGSPNRIQVQVVAADASVGATDYSKIVTPIEGIRAADLRLGSAAAKTFTIQFGVKAPAGTYCVCVTNAAENRSYISEYVIAAGEANTDVVKSVTVPGDTTGTWIADSSGRGLTIQWILMVGTTYQQAAGAWGATTFAMGSANQFNFMGTSGNTFELFDVSLTEGTVAPPFMVPDYASELAACQRYFQISGALAGVFRSAANLQVSAFFAPTTRITPTVAIRNGTGTANIPGVSNSNITSISSFGPASNAGGFIDCATNASATGTPTPGQAAPGAFAFNARL